VAPTRERDGPHSDARACEEPLRAAGRAAPERYATLLVAGRDRLARRRARGAREAVGGAEPEERRGRAGGEVRDRARGAPRVGEAPRRDVASRAELRRQPGPF